MNSVILHAACKHGLPVILLDQIMNSPEDYANPIEPASAGGNKIVQAILRVVATHNFSQHTTALYK